MTTVQFTTIAQSIADIDLSSIGVVSKRPEEIPVSGVTECPYFAPRPRAFISDVEFSRKSFGSGGTEKMDLVYSMNWQYFHAPIGQVMTFQDYGDLLDNLAYILQQIADNDAPDGAVDVAIYNITDIGGIPDAAGNQFHGVEIALRVTEFING